MKTLQLILAFLLASCAASPVTEQNLPESLLGVWHLQDGGSGSYSFSQFALLEDGRKCVVSFDIGASRLSIDAYLSHWVYNHGDLVTTFGANTVGEMPGFVMRDEIKYIDQHRLDLFMVEPPGTRLELHRKLTDVESERVCDLAARILTIRGAYTSN